MIYDFLPTKKMWGINRIGHYPLIDRLKKYVSTTNYWRNYRFRIKNRLIDICYFNDIFATLLQYKQKFYYICGVKQTSIILLLSLLVFPIIWNGISLFHYAIEHTHTFCQTESKHSHPDPDNCLSIFELSESQNQSELPATTNNEFQELKQFLTPNLKLNPILLLSFQQINSVNFTLPTDGFPKGVFLPPVFA